MRWRAIRIHCVRQVAILAMAFALAGAAYAQSPSPPPRGSTPPPDAGCNTVEKPLSAGGASIVPEEIGQQKNWQPSGGEITFTVRSFVQIPADALVLVCFRW